MARYRVDIRTVAYRQVTVEADNEEDAMDAAEGEGASLCHQCAHLVELNDEWSAVDDRTGRALGVEAI